MGYSPEGITALLRRVSAGDALAEAELYPLIYADLRRVAGALMRLERDDHTLQPTALVNEAYLRLTRGSPPDWQDRVHFFSLSARVMRRILVDHAREHGARKRGSGVPPAALQETLVWSEDRAPMLESLDDALERLAQFDPRQAQIVEWRFFGGLTEHEIAGLLGVSVRTVKREWSMARAWLNGEMNR